MRAHLNSSVNAQEIRAISPESYCDPEHPALTFLAVLDSSSDATFNIEHFTDLPKGGARPRPDPLLGRYENLSLEQVEQLLPRLHQFNERGAGIFVARNQCIGHRSEPSVTRVRGIHADMDGISAEQLDALCRTLPPSIVVQSSEPDRLQLYWQLTHGETLDKADAKAMNRRLVAEYGADPAATDVSRLLRSPGFKHMKNRAEGRTPTVVMQSHGLSYTVDEIRAAFPPLKDQPPEDKGPMTAVADGADLGLSKSLDRKPIAERVRHAHPELWAGAWDRAPRKNGITGYESRSEADLALANHIAFACKSAGVDERFLPEAVELIFDQSGLGKEPKWQSRPAYRRGTIAKAVSGLGSLVPISALQLNSHGDVRNAIAFATLTRGRFVYVTTTGMWLRWDGERWHLCEKDEHFALAKDACGEILQSAHAVFRQDQERGKKLMQDAMAAHDLRKINAMLKLAVSEPGMATTARELDSDPYLLGCQNGVIDLRTGHHLLNQPEYLITRYCNAAFASGAQCDRWLQFLDQIFLDDAATIASVQLLLGCTLLGLSSEEVLVICYGHGSNGKSVFSNVIHQIMGSYSVTAPPSLLTARKNGDSSPRDDMAAIAGARCVSINETQAGDVLDEQVVKMLAGREPISARPLYGTYFEFSPMFTPWLRTNHKPIIKGEDDGIWRRLVLLRFGRKFEDQDKDPHLEEKLLAERSGILMWMVEGALKYLKDGGLQTSPAMKAELGTYRRESDLLGDFLQENTMADSSQKVFQNHLYEHYKRWCLAGGLRPLTKKSLTQRMTERGFGVGKSGRSRSYTGLRLALADDLLSQDRMDRISVALGKPPHED